MESVEDRLTRLEVSANTTKDEQDRIRNGRKNFRGEMGFRLDRIDADHAAIRKTLRTLDGKIDVILTRLGPSGT